jgi:hypothetical protein
MNFKFAVRLAIALVLFFPFAASGKKKPQPRGMLERMEAVPCGAKQRGLAGLGSIWASVGITHVNSDEKLCPQYLVRTDDADYEIRPKDLKHPVVLPVGQEVVFKLKKDEMLLKVPEGSDKKTRAYQVVAIRPVAHDNDAQSASRGANDRSDRP